MREILKQSWGIVIVLTAVACGSNNDAGTSDSAEGAAAGGTSAATAGKTASGGTGSPRAGTGASAGGGATVPRAGSSATTQPAAAGKSGAGGKGAAVSDEDAGVSSASGAGGKTGSTAGSGGKAGSAGTAGKAGSGGATAAAGSGGSASGATFTEVYALITKGCAGATCHVSTTIAAGGMLSMSDKATAYKNLVGVNATQCAGEKRVVANDPAKSELVASLKHTQVGSCARTPRMPDNMPQWNDTDIAVVTSWIQAGAKDD